MTHTPVELRNGRWYKREDLYCAAHGVNGAKLRACQHLIGRAVQGGARRIVSAASVLSPQNAMASVVAAEQGVPCTVIVGATNPTSAVRHRAIAIAVAAGAEVEYVPVAYNPYLQRAARNRADAEPDAWRLPYGITTPERATLEELTAFARVGAHQVGNLPREVETLVLPFGSGNTAAGVLYGLFRNRNRVRRVVLVGIGPNRLTWLHDRLRAIEAPWPDRVELVHYDLHTDGYARYSDRMPGVADGIELHPTYEGKVLRYLDEINPKWWAQRDGRTCLWIVGGPIG